MAGIPISFKLGPGDGISWT